MSSVTDRELLLSEAATLVTSDRNKDYGDPKDNFEGYRSLVVGVQGCDVHGSRCGRDDDSAEGGASCDEP
jgi:hypothetical protein